MPLPGTEDWRRRDIERMIAFERETPEAIADLMPLIASANGEGPQGIVARRAPTDAPFALQRAAELAFASDQVGLGLDICAQIVTWLRPKPPSPMQWALWATAGALSGQVLTILTPKGARAAWFDDALDQRSLQRIRRLGDFPARKGIVEIDWPEGSANVVALGRKLIPAVLASVGPQGLRTLYIEDLQPSLRIAAETALRLTDEFRAADFLSDVKTASLRDADDSLRALEHRYTQRLRFLRASPRWKRLSVPIPLIDWGLLGLYLGAVRLGREEFDQRLEPGSAPAFIWQLALNIAHRGRLPLG